MNADELHAQLARLETLAAVATPPVTAPAPAEAAPAPARKGFTLEECDAWLHANGWRRGPGGDWVAPPTKGATAAD